MRISDWSSDVCSSDLRQSRTMGIPPQFVPGGIQDTGHVAATFAFDLDLWGRNRAALADARGEAEAARVDAAQARLMLDRKSTRLNSITKAHLVCRLLLEKKKTNLRKRVPLSKPCHTHRQK